MQAASSCALLLFGILAYTTSYKTKAIIYLHCWLNLISIKHEIIPHQIDTINSHLTVFDLRIKNTVPCAICFKKMLPMLCESCSPYFGEKSSQKQSSAATGIDFNSQALKLFHCLITFTFFVKQALR